MDAVRAATERFAKPIVLVGHSGAGPLMPRMADASGKVAALIFVDAMLPPASGHAQLADPTFLSQLRGLANNGLLPPWSEWFGKDAMRRLVPDDGLRAALELHAGQDALKRRRAEGDDEAQNGENDQQLDEREARRAGGLTSW